VQIFRKYLEEKLSDPEFNEIYYKNCAICPLTVRLVTAIKASTDQVELIASQCDIPVQTIMDLETAEKCCVESVKKLCDHFGIPRPADCLQFRTRS